MVNAGSQKHLRAEDSDVLEKQSRLKVKKSGFKWKNNQVFFWE